MATSIDSLKDQLLFLPLGGSNEIGMNLNLYQLDGKWLMIDLGLGFADEYLPGIDVVLPDIDFIASRRKDLLGLVITHAHEDHIGAVAYLWDELKCPIYATKFTAEVLRSKLQGEGYAPNAVPIREIVSGKPIDLGPFHLDFIPMAHSVPEMQAIVLKTRYGNVLHTGDWKLDPAPLVGPVTDEATLKRYGDEGILAMVCDSTNVFVEGTSGSEGDVREELFKVIADCPERVIVTTFASNVARVESIMLAAKACGRKVVLAGRSLFRMTEAARMAGYLQGVPEPISDKEAAGLPRNKVVIICTGGQGESRAALSRLTTGSHPTLRIAAGDTVVFSTRVIPGNEAKVRWIKNNLIEQGLELITADDAAIHVSGHPARAELDRMYDLVRPKIAIPVHGEPSHLREHADFAAAKGVKEIILGHNGAAILLSGGEPRVVDQVASGYIAVDGSSLIPITSPVIRARRKLRDDGNITVSLVFDAEKRLASTPQITAPGCLDSLEDEALRHALEEDMIRLFDQMNAKKATLHNITDKVRSTLRKRIQEELDKRPVIEVHLHQI